HANRPVRAIESESVCSSSKSSIGVCSAASSVCRRLKIEFRIVRVLQYTQFSGLLLNSVFLLGRECACRNSFLGRCSLRQSGNDRTFLDLHIAVRNRENVRQSRAADFLLLSSTRQVCLGPRQFCV